MTPLNTLVEELKTLPPEKLERAAEYVHSLKEGKRAVRLAALRASSGCLSAEASDEMERAIREGCERVDERDWQRPA